MTKSAWNAATAAAVAVVLSALVPVFSAPPPRTLTFKQRVEAQRAIEQVYWNHRIWPADNPGPKPPLSAVMPDAEIRAKVVDALRKSQALEMKWGRSISPGQLQAEMNRMAANSQNPEILRELFHALHDDPFVIAECLARPVLADRLIRDSYATWREQPFDSWWETEASSFAPVSNATDHEFTVPVPSAGAGACGDNLWTPVAASGVSRSFHTAVWTGSEMIVWGGRSTANGPMLNSGGRYDPATDTWNPTTTSGAPVARNDHTAVWTGTRMIVWGGSDGSTQLSSGAAYDPSTDSWQTLSAVSAPTPRSSHTAIWTGAQMIVWGGNGPSGSSFLDTGGRYDLATDTWVATNTTGAPIARFSHTAVWTGFEMIVWGGNVSGGAGTGTTSTGGRYSPSTDSWTPTPSSGLSFRTDHTAIWTGTEMIVWGGRPDRVDFADNLGARFNPASGSWALTTTAGAPFRRFRHNAVWTGSLMIVWGGFNAGQTQALNTGGRYDPSADSWVATSTVGAPSPRAFSTAIWSGTEMVIWGGLSSPASGDNGGRYCGVCVGTSTFYLDNDGDGYGTASSITACGSVPPPGYATQTGDCHNNDASIYPDAPQLCDGKNNNCFDPNWPAVPANEANADGDSQRICAGDCNDASAIVYSGAPQLCDGINNDCLAAGWPTPPTNEADADADTFRICQNDCNDSNSNIRPDAVETCNGIDDNCNFTVDEDALGVDTDGDTVRNACDNCRTVSNPTQTDSDADQVGNACDNCSGISNTNQSDADSDGRGDVCDNCINTANGFQDDVDADRVGDACDSCLFEYNPTQSDTNQDGEGDVCDLNDGLIYILGTDDDNYIEWQQEAGPQSWNVYEGDLAVLKSSGTYTQAPGSNSQADRHCGVTDNFQDDFDVPPVGRVTFHLVTGVTGGIEGSLGANSAGTPRPNANPCP